MEIGMLIAELQAELRATFAQVAAWFDKPASLREFVPADEGWTIDEVLNHIGLTNYYLLILIEKGANKALVNAQSRDLVTEAAAYQFPRENWRQSVRSTLFRGPVPSTWSRALTRVPNKRCGSNYTTN